MEERLFKGWLRTLRLGMMVGLLALGTAGQSWGWVTATSRAEIKADSVSVNPTGSLVVNFEPTHVVDQSTFPDVADAGGYATSSVSTAGMLSVTAAAGASTGNLYAASASYTDLLNFSVTGGSGDITLSILAADFLLSNSSFNLPYTAAAASAFLELWNTTTGVSDFILLVNGNDASITVPFTTGDVGFYSIGMAADASASVPEPSTFLLAGGGLAAFVFARKKKTA